jgi:3-hydroxybutyryl-CoA dehydrogenase
MPFAREIGQIPIHYKQEYHGYIFNSIFGAMQRQALDLVIERVASFEDIDRSWMGIFKMPIGPFGMFDQIGLDTIAEILGHWAETLNDDASRRRVEYLKAWMAQGFLGAKSSRGFYRYPSPAYVGSGFLSGEKVS